MTSVVFASIDGVSEAEERMEREIDQRTAQVWT
jgi:hypothetical protein